jgi:hypothetical protein
MNFYKTNRESQVVNESIVEQIYFLENLPYPSFAKRGIFSLVSKTCLHLPRLGSGPTPHPSPLPLPTGRQALGRGWGEGGQDRVSLIKGGCGWLK